MSLLDTAASLGPSGKVRLVTVDASEFSGGVHRFHYSPFYHTAAEIAAARIGTTDTYDETALAPKPIWFGGVMYDFWPFEIQSMALSTDQAASPTLTASNLEGYLTALCIQFRDLLDAKVTIIETFAEYLDARNFPAGNATADASAYSYEVFWLDQKTSEDDESITWAMSSPADLQGKMLPARQITSLCEWALRGDYRSGDGCTYNGTAYFDAKGNAVSDPALDQCGGCYSDCYKRFGAGLANPKAAVLDFGGFLAAQLINQ